MKRYYNSPILHLAPVALH